MTDRGPTEAAPPVDAFRFGRNWQRFVEGHLTPEGRAVAESSVRQLLGTDDLTGRTFLDVGCGSGLFSLAALQLGAAQILSLDVDLESVAACRSLRESAGSPEHWEVLHGSVLDDGLRDRVGTADVVYSWGVLHHTGDMWTAIRNAAALVEADGLFAVAIYNDIRGRLITSARWVPIKRFYNRAPRPVQAVLESAYIASRAGAQIARGRRPRVVAAEYGSQRGMAVRTDVADWLGGYPYEYATADEVRKFCEALGFKTIHITELAPGDNGNNEFLFRRAG